MKRTPLKRGNVSLRRTPIKKVSRARNSTIKYKREDSQEMKLFFLEVWNSREHKCQSCGSFLGHEPKTYMFDHLLEKSKYPEHRLNPDNIFIVCLQCHSSKTGGSPSINHLKAINQIKEKLEL